MLRVGTRETFRGFGVASLFMLLIFLAMQYPSYRDTKSPVTRPAAVDDVQPVLTARDIETNSQQQREHCLDGRERDIEEGVGEPVDGNGNRVPAVSDIRATEAHIPQ